MNGANGNSGFGWMLIVVGLVVAGIGLLWVLARNLPKLGRLPGDIVIERGNSRFYFPVVTCVLISAILNRPLGRPVVPARRGRLSPTHIAPPEGTS